MSEGVDIFVGPPSPTTNPSPRPPRERDGSWREEGHGDDPGGGYRTRRGDGGPPGGGFLTILPWLALAVVLGFVFLRGCEVPIIDDDDSPVISGGPAVLFVVEDGNDSLTVGQAQTTISAKVQTFCEENDVLYRRYDADADLSGEDEIVREMMRAGLDSDPPCFVLAGEDGRGVVRDVPESPDEAVRQIKELVD